MKQTDVELLVLLKQGDEQSFQELYNRYWKKIFNTAYQKTGNKEASEELVQDIFVSLWNRRKELTIENSLSSYLFQAVRFRSINYIRTNVALSGRLTSLQPFVDVSDNSTEEHIAYQELSQEIQQKVESLPTRSKRIFKLSRYGNFSNKNIAEQLNMTEKNVEYHITKSIKQQKN